MTNSPRFSVQPPQGKPLPSDWQSKAHQRAKMAETGYLHDLENAWRGQTNAADANIMRQSRLHPPEWRDLLGER
jgi:hypothetical protein